MNNLRANTASSLDWIKASENMVISSYDSVFGSPMVYEGSQEGLFARTDIEDSVRDVTRSARPPRSEE